MPDVIHDPKKLPIRKTVNAPQKDDDSKSQALIDQKSFSIISTKNIRESRKQSQYSKRDLSKRKASLNGDLEGLFISNNKAGEVQTIGRKHKDKKVQ